MKPNLTCCIHPDLIHVGSDSDRPACQGKPSSSAKGTHASPANLAGRQVTRLGDRRHRLTVRNTECNYLRWYRNSDLLEPIENPHRVGPVCMYSTLRLLYSSLCKGGCCSVLHY
ncbi:hypothetical protein SRHO_G00303430 [Serrasalmus rhombeus]